MEVHEGHRRPLIVTWCSASKYGQSEVAVQSGSPRSQTELEEAWLALISSATPTAIASKLYKGRSFSIARDAAIRLDADLSIVSAGLGWVRGTTVIPSYDFTVSRGPTSITFPPRLSHESWWRAVLKGPFSTNPLEDVRDRPRVYACVSQQYAAFFAAALDGVEVDRVRLFGAGLERKLPASLRTAIMPYDDRLNRLSGGTRSDFAQRSMHHFLFSLGGSKSLAADRSAVSEAMSRLPAASKVVTGRSCTDDDIRKLIASLVPDFAGRRTAMLRYFRDELHIACEQRRFSRLHTEVVEG